MYLLIHEYEVLRVDWTFLFKTVSFQSEYKVGEIKLANGPRPTRVSVMTCRDLNNQYIS